MKTILRIAAALVGIAVFAALAGLGFLAAKRPAQRPAMREKIEATLARLARGASLVHHVTPCLHCHSTIDDQVFGGEIKAGTEGMGGFQFSESDGVPGFVQAQNITPDPETGNPFPDAPGMSEVVAAQ